MSDILTILSNAKSKQCFESILTKVPKKYEEFKKDIVIYRNHPKIDGKGGRDPFEEFMTQVLCKLALKNENFKKAFLQLLTIADKQFLFEAEKGVNIEDEKQKKRELDICGIKDGNIISIENKINAEVDLEQIRDYARYMSSKKFTKNKTFVMITMFSGGFSEPDDMKTSKEQTLNGIANAIHEINRDIIVKHLYWHELLPLLTEIDDDWLKKELTNLFSIPRKIAGHTVALTETWTAEIGNLSWKKELLKEYNKFAGTQKKTTTLGSITISKDKQYFNGAIIQGARSAHSPSLLRFYYNGKDNYSDLSVEAEISPQACIDRIKEYIRKN